ncbi:MAG: efflux RND transporter permease subunit [Pseudomonadota bacterium]
MSDNAPSISPGRGGASGLVAWMAENHVAANLLMLALIFGGLFALDRVRQETFPTYATNTVTVSVSYPGASPEEVEEGVVLAIESELRSISGITSVTSSANEGRGYVSAELSDGVDPDRLSQDIRNGVDRITSFPDDAEPARVELQQRSRSIVDLAIIGNIPEADLFALTERMRNDLLNLESVAQVQSSGRRAPEISIEIPEERLRALNLTLEDVAGRVRAAARDVPAGGLETADGEFLLRTEGRRERGLEFGDIPLKTDADGSKVFVQDIAKVVDGFEEGASYFRFNGKPGMRLRLLQAETGEPIELAKEVMAYVAQFNETLPEGVEVVVTRNFADVYKARMSTLVKNGVIGLILVIITLGLFLNLRLAFWVALSIPIVFIGSFTILLPLDISINMISMFAFILTLGIVVDDAIIVGENIYAKTEAGLPVNRAVVDGVREMTVPVLFAVGTNIIAFIPLMMVPGETGQFLISMPIVACIVFFVSLIEALLILPAHLNAKGKPKTQAAGLAARLYAPMARVSTFREGVAKSLDRLRDGPFRKTLAWSLSHRYVTLVLFAGFIVLIGAWNQSGRIELQWRPRIPSNSIDAELTMPTDATFAETLAIAKHIETAGLRAIDQLPGGREALESWSIEGGGRDYTEAEVTFSFASGERAFTQDDFTRTWRREIGPLPSIKTLTFDFLVGPGAGKALRVNLSHPSNGILEDAARELANTMRSFSGVVEVSDGVTEGKRQIRFTLTDEARALGLTENGLGRQLRAAGFGAEALRMLRDGNEVKVMVRLPQAERDSVSSLADFIVRTPTGIEIPLSQAAHFDNTRAFTSINREDGQRVIRVTGGVDLKSGASPGLIMSEIGAEALPAIALKYPGLTYDIDSGFGGRRGRNEALGAILSGLAGMIVIIYALMASLFRSYTQGAVVMLTIPASVAAAIAGHIIMGHNLSSSSVYGMIALCGLVVNGALVLTKRYNEMRADGATDADAIVNATVSRFRPIVLTSITTTAGLTPMLFETSVQALFLVPLAIALSFGTVFSTFVILFLIPTLHMLHSDAKRALSRRREKHLPYPAE